MCFCRSHFQGVVAPHPPFALLRLLFSGCLNVAFSSSRCTYFMWNWIYGFITVEYVLEYSQAENLKPGPWTTPNFTPNEPSLVQVTRYGSLVCLDRNSYKCHRKVQYIRAVTNTNRFHFAFSSPACRSTLCVLPPHLMLFVDIREGWKPFKCRKTSHRNQHMHRHTRIYLFIHK